MGAPEDLYCRYCLEKVKHHEQKLKTDTPWPRTRALFKCAKGPVGWLNWRDHTYTATEDLRR